MAEVERLLVSTLPELVAVLRRARVGRGMSQRQAAEALFVEHSTVSHWELGACRPTAGGLIAWARLVGMPLWAVPEREAAGSTSGTSGIPVDAAFEAGNLTELERRHLSLLDVCATRDWISACEVRELLGVECPGVPVAACRPAHGGTVAILQDKIGNDTQPDGVPETGSSSQPEISGTPTHK